MQERYRVSLACQHAALFEWQPMYFAIQSSRQVLLTAVSIPRQG
jgi:ABC-type polysaccharide/polyol phosphate export permease